MSTPWVSRAPNNPTEATSQSEYIKNRIAQHQNSSPTLIYKAIDRFLKEAQGIMHKIVLLQSGNCFFESKTRCLANVAERRKYVFNKKEV